MKIGLKISGVILLFLSFSCKKDSENIRVFCAASLADVVHELKDSFEVHNTIQVKLNIASSGTLARQIEHGNPADIFLSANQQWANYVDSSMTCSVQKPLYTNKLALIIPIKKSQKLENFTFEDTLDIQDYLSLGNPNHVPLGQYSKEALQNLGWWENLEHKILPAKDARAALLPVELGECQYGIVYYSDALASKKIQIQGIFPDSLHSKISFYALLSSQSSKEAKDFFAILTDTNYQHIWIKHGLSLVLSIE